MKNHPAFHVVLVYDNYEDGIRAKDLFDWLVSNYGAFFRLICHLWGFDVLREPQLFEGATRDAIGADMIVFAIRQSQELPVEVRRWIGRWLPSKQVDSGALVLLPGDPPRQVGETTTVCVTLKQIAESAKRARRLHLIWDGGFSHESDYTRRFLHDYRGWVRVLSTPPHASWLNQGELLLRAFAARFLCRGNWQSAAGLVEHLVEATDEYNRLFAHPFTWSWTRQDMRRLIAQKNPGLHSRTCRTVH